MSTLKQPVNTKSPHIHVVYKHTAPNGKSYIGITNHYTRRSSQHRNTDACSIFHRAIDKYGWENFKHEFLAVGLTLEAANHFEEFYIRTHDTLSPNGYNLKTGGDVGKNNPITNEKISEANKGRIVSEETRIKISESNMGKTHTPESRAKMSKSQKGRVISPESSAKRIATVTGRKNSESTKYKIGFANKKPHFKLEYASYCNNIISMPENTIFKTNDLKIALDNNCSGAGICSRILTGEFPNAYKGKNNVNLIPITDVISYYEKYKEIYLVDSDVELP